MFKNWKSVFNVLRHPHPHKAIEHLVPLLTFLALGSTAFNNKRWDWAQPSITSTGIGPSVPSVCQRVSLLATLCLQCKCRCRCMGQTAPLRRLMMGRPADSRAQLLWAQLTLYSRAAMVNVHSFTQHGGQDSLLHE